MAKHTLSDFLVIPSDNQKTTHIKQMKYANS